MNPKTTLVTVLLLMLQQPDLPDDVHSVPNIACFRKELKSYLFKKALLPYCINYPVSSCSQAGHIYGIMMIDLVSGVAP